MDKNELDKLEALAKAATPGPWTGQAVVGYRGNLFEVRQGVSVGVAGSVHDPANASYIAAFNPAAILELIALARTGLAAPTGQQAEPVTILSDDETCALDYAVRALRAIAERQEVIDGGIEPLNDIRKAARRAKYALDRLEPVARRLCDVSPVSAVPAAPTFQPTEQQFAEWCERHDLPPHHSRDAFDDAASLYLAAPAAAQKEGTSEQDAKLANRVRDLIADHLADNWPMVRYHLEEVEKKVRAINADYLLCAAMSAAQAQPKDTTDTTKGQA